MSFLKSLFGKKSEPIQSNADFWQWFQENEKDFYKVVQQHDNIERGFFSKLEPKLNELKEGYFYLTGMADKETAELVLTADGNPKNVAFVEELVAAAPAIKGWKITAHKEPMNIEHLAIGMGDYKFSSENLHFYANDKEGYPDVIDITVVHDDLNEANKGQLTNGTFIFLDNYLGELAFLTTIDAIKVLGKQEAEKELVPIAKLKDFLIWRQKEFIEKYEGLRYDTENDEYSILEAELKSGNNLVAVINTELLQWDSKASHPWLGIFTITYDGSKTNGMPAGNDYELLKTIEDELVEQLQDKNGYLNIGRQTAENDRDIYFACTDFRLPSKVFYAVQQKYQGKAKISYELFKDKYWQAYERFA